METAVVATATATPRRRRHHAWLARLPDHVPLGDIPAIPGTHNSATRRPANPLHALPWVWARCQHAGIREQFEMGVRVLDLRLVNDERGARCSGAGGADDAGGCANDAGGGDGAAAAEGVVLRVAHSFMTDQTFGGIVRAAVEFLAEHPSEFLVIRFKRDWPHRHKWSARAQARLSAVLRSVPPERVVVAAAVAAAVTTSSWCDARARLGSVRGRIVFACPDTALQQVDEEAWAVHPTAAQRQRRRHLHPAFHNDLDVWNAKTQRRARALLQKYAARALEQPTRRPGDMADGAGKVEQQGEEARREAVSAAGADVAGGVVNPALGVPCRRAATPVRLRSVGVNVVVGALPPQAVARSMNKWLRRLLSDARRHLQLQQQPEAGSCEPAAASAPPPTVGTTTNGAPHFGVLMVDFVDEDLVDAMVQLSYARLLPLPPPLPRPTIADKSPVGRASPL